MDLGTSGPKGAARRRRMQRHKAAASSLCRTDGTDSLFEANVWQHRGHPAICDALRMMVPVMVDGQLRCSNCRTILHKSYIQIHACGKKKGVPLSIHDMQDGLVNASGPFPRCTLCNVILGKQQHCCAALSRMGLDLSALFGDGDAAGGRWDEEALSQVRNNVGHWVTVFPDLWAPPGQTRILCHHLYIWKRSVGHPLPTLCTLSLIK